MPSSRPDLLGTPLGQFGLGAVALVIGGALLFSLIGAVTDGEGSDDAGQAAASPSAPATDDPTGSAPDDAAPGTEAATTDPAVEGTTTDAPTEQPTDQAPTEADTGPPAIDPGSITIQVLDGSDDAADQDAVVGCLQGAGYDSLITGNRSVTTYSTTAVFYTPGEDNQAAAQQVAGVLGIGAVEQKPTNLSDSVPVHVVTGQDGDGRC